MRGARVSAWVLQVNSISAGTSPWRGVMFIESASLLVGLVFDSRLGLTTTLHISTVTFLPGAWCVEELRELSSWNQNRVQWYLVADLRPCRNSALALHDRWCHQVKALHKILHWRSIRMKRVIPIRKFGKILEVSGNMSCTCTHRPKVRRL